MVKNFFEPSVDVFMSYSHGASQGNSNSTLKQWSQKLAEDLQEELGVDRKSKIVLFLDGSERPDEGIARSGSIRAQLKSNASKAATFLVLMTGDYLDSQWCTQEREWWFQENVPDPFNVGARHFICRVMPTASDDWPEVFKEEETGEESDLGFFFYDRDAVADRGSAVRPYCWRGGTADLNQYNEQLNLLLSNLLPKIDEVRTICKERSVAEEQQARLRKESGQSVFLHAREGDSEQFDTVRKTLQRERFAVFPNGPVHIEEHGGMDPELMTQLQGSDALILLTSEKNKDKQDPGIALDTDMQCVGRRSMRPCAILNTIGEDIKDKERHIGNAKIFGMHWLEASDDKWPISMRNWLTVQGEYV